MINVIRMVGILMIATNLAPELALGEADSSGKVEKSLVEMEGVPLDDAIRNLAR